MIREVMKAVVGTHRLTIVRKLRLSRDAVFIPSYAVAPIN